ncbi:MAG: hypothetical protein HYV07_01615 [Deltaproteobacteria bacterium]|nr:hypothetical protein [Deltaproteobacteria bacterium]
MERESSGRPSDQPPHEQAVEIAPPGNALNRLVERLAHKVHPVKHGDPNNPPGPNRITHERPFLESKGFAFGVEFGLTVSELHQVRRRDGIELVHVVNPDGSSNLETVLGRVELRGGQRIELQGPALNTSLTPGELPLGARFAGVGLTSDLIDPKSHEAVSYTLEVKATERTAAELALLAAPGAAALATEALGSEVAGVVASIFAGAIPVVGAAIAVSSARHALKILKSPKQSKLNKAFAVAHAVSDAVRVFLPLVGVIGNAALVAAQVAVSYVKVKKLREERAALRTARPPPLPTDVAEPQRVGEAKGDGSGKEGQKGDRLPISPPDLPSGAVPEPT